MTEAKVREAVGVFHDEAALQAAADELMAADFDRSALSLLAGNQAVEEKLGHAYEKVAELEDLPDAPTQAYAAVKRAVGDGFDLTLEEGLAIEAAEFGGAFATEDARIGVAAFLAKETPEFVGH